MTVQRSKMKYSKYKILTQQHIYSKIIYAFEANYCGDFFPKFHFFSGLKRIVKIRWTVDPIYTKRPTKSILQI